MPRNKKTFVTFALLFGLIGLLIFINTRPSIVIDSYEATVTINDSGDMTVVERWDMVYNEAMSVRFRDIAYNKYGEGYTLPTSNINRAHLDEVNIGAKFYKDGVDVSNQISIGYSFNGDRDELGNLITCEPNVSQCDSIFVDTRAAGGMEGNVSFEYEYTILGAITQYSDISELNWRLFTYAEGKIKNATIVVNFPTNSYSMDDMYVWGHGNIDGTIEKTSNAQVTMEMKNIKVGDYPEFRILVQNSLFPNIDANNVYIYSGINKDILIAYEADLADQYNQLVVGKDILLYGGIALLAVMGVLVYLVYVKFDKEYDPEFTGDYYRELPNEDTPADVCYLYYMKKINDTVFTATLLDLIRRKYILMDTGLGQITSKDATFYLKRNPEKPWTDLLAHESHLMNWIFKVIGNGNDVSTKDIEKYGAHDESKARSFQSYASSFVRLSKQSAMKKKYFESGFKEKNKTPLLVMLVPVAYILLSWFISSTYGVQVMIYDLIAIGVAIIYNIYLANIKKRTREGNELFTKWKAFRRFLLEFGNMKDYPIPGIIVWEHYLVYATVLNVADKVMEQLTVKLPEDAFESDQGTYLTNQRYYRHYYGSPFYRLNTAFAVARMNSNATIVRANAAKAGRMGGGGGFGGGSSFGGGGGGGRSR